MKNFQDIMIATDLDGTFFSSEAKEVPRNIEAIKYFTENGGIFTFATGRASWNTDVLLPNAGEYLNHPAITCNGMTLYDMSEHTPVREYFIPSEQVVELVDVILPKFSEVCFRAAGLEGIFVFQPEHPILVREQKKNPVKYFVCPYKEWISYKFYKITMRAESEILDEVKAYLDNLFGDKYNICKSWPTILEILPKGRSKAEMLREVKNDLEENGRKIKLYAVGDFENDIDMLKMADVAVCPDNALDCVKEICDLCLCDNDSGVIADLIYKLDEDILPISE